MGVEGLRLTIVNAGRVDADGVHLAILDQPPRCLGGEPGEVQFRYGFRPPPGGPEMAHQIINTGSEEMRYLAVSTMNYPEAVEYPDSRKVAILSRQLQPDGQMRVTRHVNYADKGVNYWDGE